MVALLALVALVVRDLDLPADAGIDPLDDREYYDIPVEEFTTTGASSALSAYCSLLKAGQEADRTDTEKYFLSLAALHRARLKFANIVRLQPTPTLEQVGLRGLLQYGNLNAEALGSLLIVRKWLYDIDNRSAQETGYLFEPVIAGAVGGRAVPASSSPVKRRGTNRGRQVDCLRDEDKKAYEIKLRITDAPSGQGRWPEELAFPADCRASGYIPVLVVFDGTDNPKLSQLSHQFRSHGGQAHVGEHAWAHLKSEAGDKMSTFIEKYIRAPIDDLLDNTPTDLPPVSLQLQPDSVRIRIGATEIRVDRTGSVSPADASMPNDVDATLPELD